MSYSITEENIDQLDSIWQGTRNSISWQPLFLLPTWLHVWLEVFAPSEKATVFVVRDGNDVIGIAPFLIKNGVAGIIGSPNVCDYFDFPVVPGREKDFYKTLLDGLKERNIKTLDCCVVRPDSTIITSLLPVAKQAGYNPVLEPDEVTLETELPATWDAYLESLDGKQRHEVRRKLRRLSEAGEIGYRFVADAASVPAFADTFLKMFVESRSDKATFLTGQMNVFFRTLLRRTAEIGLLRAVVLELDSKPLATLTAFDYQGTIYLYNSGYDPEASSLSVGILSKAMLIKDSIENGKMKFDFLKGGEPYKYFLGGKEIALQKCRINLG